MKKEPSNDFLFFFLSKATGAARRIGLAESLLCSPHLQYAGYGSVGFSQPVLKLQSAFLHYLQIHHLLQLLHDADPNVFFFFLTLELGVPRHLDVSERSKDEVLACLFSSNFQRPFLFMFRSRDLPCAVDFVTGF